MLGSLNKVELSDNCENSQLFNTHKQLRIELEYSWKFASDIPEMAAYNDAVKNLRETENKPVSFYLKNLTELTKFQIKLAEKLAGIPSTVPVNTFTDEDTEASDYDTSISKVKGTASAVNSSDTSED